MSKPGLGTIYRFANIGQTIETTTGDVGSLHTAEQMGFNEMEHVGIYMKSLKSDQKNLMVLNILFPTHNPNETLSEEEKNKYCFFITQFQGDYSKTLDKLVDPFNLNSIGGKNGIYVSRTLKDKENEIIKNIGDWESIWHYSHYGYEKSKVKESCGFSLGAKVGNSGGSVKEFPGGGGPCPPDGKPTRSAYKSNQKVW